jgi:D-arginine dehydrogenase
MRMSTHYDIAIIGAGIAGVGLAAAIGKGPSVAIVEQEARHGHHSTGRSAAIYIRNYGNAVVRALNDASAPFFDRGDPSLFPHRLLTPRGILNVADADGLEKHEAMLVGTHGMEILTPAQAIAMVPALRPEKLVAAAYERDAQDIDVSALHDGWLRRARGRAERRHLADRDAGRHVDREGSGQRRRRLGRRLGAEGRDADTGPSAFPPIDGRRAGA